MSHRQDSGGGWQHFVYVRGRADAMEDPVRTTWTGHGVAEDTGGSCGWETLKDLHKAKGARPFDRCENETM